MTQIEWVNHASFVVRHGDVSLISDPWLFGTAFDDGWSLLAETKFCPQDFAGITHIWLSHEHSDHFSPASLRSISEEHRNRITVLYQQTSDGKVVNWCRDLGFMNVIELPAGQWFSLADDFRVLCQPFPDHDSWLAMDLGDELLLNLNDCMVRSPRELAAVRADLPKPVAVVFTQFSYASWVGNRDEPGKLHDAAAKHLGYIEAHVRAFEPRYTVPFASFVRFSHEENAYLNAGMNTVHTAYAHLKGTPTIPVVLYPGQRWEVGQEWDSEEALCLYAEDYARAAENLTPAEPVPLGTLREYGHEFAGKLVEHHGKMTIRAMQAAGILKPVHIYLPDQQKAVGLSLPEGLRASARDPQNCDVEMTSDALAYTFRNLWGGNTLLVNGRFQAAISSDSAAMPSSPTS